MSSTSTSRSEAVPAAGSARETALDRLGIPHALRWGFLGVLVFMTGNGVETNFVSPHMANVFGGGDEMINLAATVITFYSAAALFGSYLAGALSDLWGPRKVMLLGVIVWVVFQAAFVGALATESVPLIFAAYTVRGFGFPLFAFSFLVWINAVTPKERNGAAVGWFYVMFTGGMPTIGSLVAIGMIPAFGGGFLGERWAMIASTAIVVAGFLIAYLGVREEHGDRRLAPEGESNGAVILSGVILSWKNKRVLLGFLTRLINTAPQFGMFIILPTVIAETPVRIVGSITGAKVLAWLPGIVVCRFPSRSARRYVSGSNPPHTQYRYGTPIDVGMSLKSSLPVERSMTIALSPNCRVNAADTVS